MSKVRIGELIQRRREQIKIEDDVTYKQVTIRTKHKGVVLRGMQKGAAIGTKNQYVTHQDQFILSCIDARQGAFGIVPAELEGAIITNDFWCFDINEQLVLRDFFYTLIQAPDFDDACKKASIGTTNRQRINESFFLGYELEIPPIEEQANAVRQIMAARQHLGLIEAELAHQATLLTRLRQTILREAVQGRLLPQDPTDEPAPALLARIRAEKQRLIKEKKLRAEKPLPPLNETEMPYEVPQGWVWCRLGNLVLKSEAGKSLTCYPYPASYPKWGIIKVSAMSWGAFDETENKELPEEITPELAYQIMPGDYLVSRANTSELIGRSVLVGKIKANLLLSDKSIRMLFAEDVDKEYISLCNATEYARTHYKSVATGTSDSMKNLGREQMYALTIPLPPLAEQRRIVAKVAELLDHCTELEAELGRARAAASALHAAALREAFAPAPTMVPD